MKIAITTEHGNLVQERTTDEFAMDKEAETAFGKIVLALAKEKGWSDEYKMTAFFSRGKAHHLSIFHPAFLDGRPFVIRPIDGVESIEDVEEALKKHLQASIKRLNNRVSALLSQGSSLQKALDKIQTSKAEA